MKNKSTLLILLSIFILFAFLQGVTALDDNSTNANSNEVLFADNNQIIQNSDEVSLDSETSLTYNDASSGSNIESSSKIPIADENGVLFNDKSDNIPMDHSPNHSSLTLQNDTVYYGNQAQYLLKDISGNPLANAKVTISINGMDYEKTTDNNGIAKLTIKLISNKKYNITASYKGDSQIPAMTSRNVLTVIPTITAEDVEKIFRNKTQYYPKLTDSNGKALKDTNVTMNINGVFYTKTTNDKGIATQNINLNPGKYIITAMYKDCFVSNNITVLPVLTTSDLTKYFGIPASLNSKLVDGQGNPLANQSVTYNINGVFYNKTTDANGIAKLNISLNPGEYIATITYKSAFASAKVTVLNTRTVEENATNSEIQNIIDSVGSKGAVKFLGKVYNNISLDITKSIILTSDVNTTLNGKLNTCVLNIKADDVLVKNLNINGNNGSGIIVNNVKNTVIENNNINNLLNQSNMDNYNSGKTLLPGKGIALLNSKNTTVENNNIQYYYNGIYLNGAKYTSIQKNTITKNNFGVEFDKDASNTLINNNNIIENIGFNTMVMIEGPYGYGISMRHSGINVTVTNNRINNNYMGVFIDAKNCSGIVITGNEISNSTIEGLTVNENYTYAPGAVLIVENNAIYNNAKGPSQIILGEVSANPNGIYGPGEWNDTLKLQLGPNWYGTNKYTTWGLNQTGPGTICPRIHTTLIPYNITCISPGKYEVTFYNNSSIASKLPDLTTYFVLNYNTDKEKVVEVVAHQGKATFEFSAKNYNETNNIIEGFSVFDPNRPKSVIYTYNVPESEIPK